MPDNRPPSSVLDPLLAKRILILDGAMGTMIQRRGLTEEELRRVETELERARKEGEKTAGSWRQVRESQFRLNERPDAGGGEGKPPIRW